MGRDLLRFAADPLPTAQRVLAFTVQLLLEAPSGQAQPSDVVVWFGYEEASVEASYPYQSGLGLHFPTSPSPGKVRAVIEYPGGHDGGFLLPANAIPVLLLVFSGTQSPLTPLVLHVGGDSASGINVTSSNWTLPDFTRETLYERTEFILNDNLPAPAPNSGTVVTVQMESGVIGFRASAKAAPSPISLDFDVSIEDPTGQLIAESNSPLSSEIVAFHEFNLDPNATQYQIRVVEASGKGGSYSLVVEVFKEAAGAASRS